MYQLSDIKIVMFITLARGHQSACLRCSKRGEGRQEGLLNTKYYVFGFAFSLACTFCNSTVYSTALQPYSFCSWAVFCFTNFLNESRLAALFSPLFLRASVNAWKSDSTFAWSEPSEIAILKGRSSVTGPWCFRAFWASCSSSVLMPWIPSTASCGRRYPSSLMMSFCCHSAL